MGVGISLPWFQNTIISGKRTHVAKCARPPDLTVFILFYRGAARLQGYSVTSLNALSVSSCLRVMLGAFSRCRLFVCVYGYIQVHTYIHIFY